jgi:hypothetical protein
MALIAARSRGRRPGSQGRAALAHAAGALDAGVPPAGTIGQPGHGVSGCWPGAGGPGGAGVPGRGGGCWRHCHSHIRAAGLYRKAFVFTLGGVETAIIARSDVESVVRAEIPEPELPEAPTQPALGSSASANLDAHKSGRLGVQDRSGAPLCLVMPQA